MSLIGTVTTGIGATFTGESPVQGIITPESNLTFNSLNLTTLIVNGGSTTLGSTHITDTTESTSTSTGALIVDGGAAFAKSGNFGLDLSVGRDLTVTRGLNALAAAIQCYALNASNVADATSSTTGTITTGGGISSQKAMYAGGKITTDSDLKATGALDVTGAATLRNIELYLGDGTGTVHVNPNTGVATNLRFTSNFTVIAENTANATAINTGALQSQGGFSCVNDAVIGGKLKASTVPVDTSFTPVAGHASSAGGTTFNATYTASTAQCNQWTIGQMKFIRVWMVFAVTTLASSDVIGVKIPDTMIAGGVQRYPAAVGYLKMPTGGTTWYANAQAGSNIVNFFDVNGSAMACSNIGVNGNIEVQFEMCYNTS